MRLRCVLITMNDVLRRAQRERACLLGRGLALEAGGELDLGSGDEASPLVKPRDIYIPDLHIDAIRVTPRNFR